MEFIWDKFELYENIQLDQVVTCIQVYLYTSYKLLVYKFHGETGMFLVLVTYVASD